MCWRLLLLFSFLGTLMFAQPVKDSDKKAEYEKELAEISMITSKELYAVDTIVLGDARMLNIKFNTEMEKKYYIWLRRRVRDVWPYVKVAVEEYNAIQDTSEYFTNNRQKKKYIKRRQRELANQFEDKLKDLSLSRGQILVKLIHRETGKTTYEILKELRGGVNAFIWNSAGGAYNLDFKTQFDPYRIREDLYIEVILEKDFTSGRLERIKDSD